MSADRRSHRKPNVPKNYLQKNPKKIKDNEKRKVKGVKE